jgi:hypothetical protein
MTEGAPNRQPDDRQPVSTDMLFKIIGVKEVELHMLRQQIEQLKSNAPKEK